MLEESKQYIKVPYSKNKENLQEQIEREQRERERRHDKMMIVEAYKKLCMKSYGSANQAYIAMLNSDNLNLCIENFNKKDLVNISKIIYKYPKYEGILISLKDSKQKEEKKGFGKREVVTQGEKDKLNKEERERQVMINNMLMDASKSISRNIQLSLILKKFTLYGLNVNREFAENISCGLCQNTSIEEFQMTNCKINLDAYEILLKGFLNHPKISKIDISNNKLGDKFGNMIGRIISRQSQRRDQVLWQYRLRNDLPKGNDYAKGLIELNLSGNLFGELTTECMTNALIYDSYIRKIDLGNNKMDKSCIKKFIHMMRNNDSLLNINFKGNPGLKVEYNKTTKTNPGKNITFTRTVGKETKFQDLNNTNDPEIEVEALKRRIVMKICKNIQILAELLKKGKISEQEFEELKKFVDPSLFEENVPDEAYDNYRMAQEGEEYNEYQNYEEGQEQIENTQNYNTQTQKSNISRPKSGISTTDKPISNKKNPQNKNRPLNDSEIEMILSENKELKTQNIMLKKQINDMRISKAYETYSLEENQEQYPNELKEIINEKFLEVAQLTEELNQILGDIEGKIGIGYEEEQEDANLEEENINQPEEKENKDEKKKENQVEKPKEEIGNSEKEEKKETKEKKTENSKKYEKMEAEPSENEEEEDEEQYDKNMMLENDNEDIYEEEEQGDSKLIDEQNLGLNQEMLEKYKNKYIKGNEEEDDDYEDDDDMNQQLSIGGSNKLNKSI